MSQEQHKIECAICRSVKYVAVVPFVFTCECMKPRKPGYKWMVCKNCGEGSEVEKVLTLENQCKNCEDKNSVKQLGIIHSGEPKAKSERSMISGRSPGDFDLLGYKSESEKQTEILESILEHLKKEKT